ncbi:MULTISPECIES: hypothetical protein [unclassified Lysinibacillus]|uniref:hypothetical protein n=1 Tax=Lysinibacillus TaxID=400634 RepID=UPI0035BE8359
MEIDMIADRDFIVNFFNDFIKENNLIYFDVMNYKKRGLTFGSKICQNDYLNKVMGIYIGKEQNFREKFEVLNVRKYVREDLDDFIYVLNMWDLSGYRKIYKTVMICSPTRSESVKSMVKLLKNQLKTECNSGMEVVDSKYSDYNKMLKKYYWPDEVLSYQDRLYDPQAIQIVPICNEKDKGF